MLDMAGYKIEDEILPNGDSSAHTTQNEDALNPELDSALDNRESSLSRLVAILIIV